MVEKNTGDIQRIISPYIIITIYCNTLIEPIRTQRRKITVQAQYPILIHECRSSLYHNNNSME